MSREALIAAREALIGHGAECKDVNDALALIEAALEQQPHTLCEECETASHCLANGCIPKQQPAPVQPVKSCCANCGKPSSEASEVLSDYPEDGEWFCSTECRDQHNELDCPHLTHSGYRHPVESAKLIECERIMRDLASWLGCGGYNADEFDPSEFEAKIRHGIAHLSTPPAQPAPVPLTEKELRKMHHEEQFGLFCDYDEFEQIARAVEAHHGITKGQS